jgi:hypothetical protein
MEAVSERARRRRVEQQLILDRYRPLEQLGSGGFATVTLAWDTRMQRRVAIKRFDLPRDATGVIQHNPPGLAEARTAAMLNHPAIVTVYDFATDADEAFVIMEHIDGASLETLLDDVGGPLTLDETAAVIDAVSCALEYAHENGVLHLDIKPGNVLVTRDGRVKVADFGMAELSNLGGHGTSWGGTLGYMPLEQLGGLRVNEATDEFALAVLTFECLTGANPLLADSPGAAIARLQTTDLPSVRSYEPKLSSTIDDVLFAATGPHPDDRYPSVAELWTALQPHLGDSASGRESLADLVSAYAVEDEPAERPGWDRIGLWDRLQGRGGAFALRTLAAGEAAWLAWAGLAQVHLQPLALGGAVALVALAGALAPALGTGIGLIAFAIGLFAMGLWLLGMVFALGVAVWWWFVARRSPGVAVTALAAPALGVAHLGLLAPLLAGFWLPPLSAAATGLTAGVLHLLASSASQQLAPYVSVSARLIADPNSGVLAADNVRAAFLDPAAWISLLGWPAAALAVSLFARRATRFSALVGVALGGAVLWGTNLLAELWASRGNGATAAAHVWTGTSFAVSLAGSLILMVLVIVLGAPVRAEDEELVRLAYETDD